MGISGPGPAGGWLPFVLANNTLALSPDGRSLVLAGGGRLFLRAMDSFALTPIAGSEGGLPRMVTRRPLYRVPGARKTQADRCPQWFGAGSHRCQPEWRYLLGATGTILFPGMTPEGAPAILKTDPEGRNPTIVLAPDSGRG